MKFAINIFGLYYVMSASSCDYNKYSLQYNFYQVLLYSAWKLLVCTSREFGPTITSNSPGS